MTCFLVQGGELLEWRQGRVCKESTSSVRRVSVIKGSDLGGKITRYTNCDVMQHVRFYCDSRLMHESELLSGNTVPLTFVCLPLIFLFFLHIREVYSESGQFCQLQVV